MTALFEHPWWLLLLAGIGVTAMVAVLITLFSGVGDRPDDVEMVGDCTVDSEDFLLALAGTLNAPLERGGTAQLLNNGEEFYPALYRSLREAREAINFMVYIWEPGRVSDEIFEILLERARAGVQVRVMVDGLGGHKVQDEKIRQLREAGGQWAWFHPVRFGILTRLHKRNHRRAIIIDGQVGYTGGAAVMDKWLGDGVHEGVWRDCLVEVRGPIAANLQSAFTSLWTHVTGEILVGPSFYGPWEAGAVGEDDAARQAGGEGREGVREEGRDVESGPVEGAQAPGAVAAALATDGAAARQTGTQQQEEGVNGRGARPGEFISRHVNVVSSPSSEAHPMRALFWLSFRAACQEIFITNPYFVPDDIMCKVLIERARAGVDVRVLVPGEHIDIALIRWASRSNYDPMLAAGMRIYEYQPTMIHQKSAVVDGKWSLVGSANMDVRSKELNQENTLGILDGGFARQVREAFLADLAHAREIDLDEFRRRPVHHRAREWLASLFEEQF